MANNNPRLRAWFSNPQNVIDLRAALNNPAIQNALQYLRANPEAVTPSLGTILNADAGAWGYMRGITDGALAELVTLESMAVISGSKQLPEPNFGIK